MVGGYRPAPPGATYTVGMQSERWYYLGTFIDNVKRYPHADDWIEVVWTIGPPEVEYDADLADETEPPVSIAHGFEGSCEACGVLVQVGDRIHVYADDVVVHECCPGSRERAQA